jgi:tetratricopeptide (TPR) repeat protein
VAQAEPIIVVLGPRCGGTSAVAGVLHQLGVYLGSEFVSNDREPDNSWEDARLSQLCRSAFDERSQGLRMDPDSFRASFLGWADEHSRAAHRAGRRPGAKDPLLCLAVGWIIDAGVPVVPVVVDRPFDDVVASLNRLGVFGDEWERAESTAHLINIRDRALAGTATVNVDFEALRATPGDVIRRLADELGLEVTDEQLEAAVHSVTKPAEAVEDIDALRRYIDQLLPEVERNPGDAQAVYTLAQYYFRAEDFANARRWYTRFIDIGAVDGEIFLAMLRVAQSMDMLHMPWPDVQDAYLRAWEFRPTRAEPFFGIARHYSAESRYRLGYLFAELAADMRLPDDDMIALDPDLYEWRAVWEQAECAFRIGKEARAFELWRRLLARPDIPDDDRHSIAGARDLAVPTMLKIASHYPESLAGELIVAPDGGAEVTVSVVAGADPASTAAILNSFLNCCTDITRVERFVVFDDGASPLDRITLQARYRFIEFATCAVGAPLREHIDGTYWLHLEQGWRFFAPDDYITRLTAVLDAEPQVFQVALNLGDATGLTGASAAEKWVGRAPGTGRYVLADSMAEGPSMFHLARLDEAVSGAELDVASLDEVVCIAEAGAARHRADEIGVRARGTVPSAVPASREAVQSVANQAKDHFEAGDFAAARECFSQLIDIADSEETIFWAMLRIAQSVEMLAEPWPDVLDAYLRAWEFRPTRAEPFYDITRCCIAEQRGRLGYLFAERVAEIPLPADDLTVPQPEIYGWRNTFHQLECLYLLDEHAEAFTLARGLLARPDLPDGDRHDIASIRDLTVPAMLRAAAPYPDTLVHNLIAGARYAEVTVSLVTGADRAATEEALNSFVQCCTDVSRVGRFVVIDIGLSTGDRTTLQSRYPFIEFADHDQDVRLRDHIYGRYWLHLGQGWRFFAPDDYITRLTAVLDAEKQVFQVGINVGDADGLTGVSPPEELVRRTPDAGRYVLTDAVAAGPAMFDTGRLARTGETDTAKTDPVAELQRIADAAGLRTATLDEVLCVAAADPE